MVIRKKPQESEIQKNPTVMNVHEKKAQMEISPLENNHTGKKLTYGKKSTWENAVLLITPFN